MPEAIRQSHGEASGDLIAYTMGPASGDYDVEWPASGGSAAIEIPSWATNLLAPLAIITGDFVCLSGNLRVTANAVNVVYFTLVADVAPLNQMQLPVLAADVSEQSEVLCDLTINPDDMRLTVYRADGVPFDLGDVITFSGTYLRG